MMNSQLFSVDYFFSKKIIQILGLSVGQNILESSPQEISNQLSQSNYDLVIIGTAHRYFNVFLRITQQYNSVIICHNLQFVQSSVTQLLRAVFSDDILYRLKLLCKEGLFLKSKVYKKANHLLVLDENLEKFIWNKGFKKIPPPQKLPVFFCNNDERKDVDAFQIVVPGAVSQQRRDYNHLLEVLPNISFPVEIVFLGKAQGNELQKIMNFNIASKKQYSHIKITYFTEKVSQQIFNDYMQRADLIWCPVQLKTQFFSVEEIYGVSKMSGNIGDAIKFRKPAIFPTHYTSKYPFILSEDLLFEDLIELKLALEFSRENFSDYTKDKVLLQIEKKLSEFI